MLVTELQRIDLSLDTELLEGLMVRPEAPVTGAPLPRPEGAGTLLLAALLQLSPKEPKEPRKTQTR
ncbi:hypothetical protein ACH40E_00355 [Streptomyces acidicola]|uniref:hypothetical protein n=1 Tax=Streptomyces acidicola TaxID=2596892 RepID=UPI0037A62719